MKPVKAIDLVWRAQPMIATLHTVMAGLAKDRGHAAASKLAEDCTSWLRAANVLLGRKGMAMSQPEPETEPVQRPKFTPPEPATEADIEKGDAQWCEVCTTEGCPFRGTDACVRKCPTFAPRRG